MCIFVSVQALTFSPLKVGNRDACCNVVVRDIKDVFAHNFLNVQWIFNPTNQFWKGLGLLNQKILYILKIFKIVLISNISKML